MRAISDNKINQPEKVAHNLAYTNNVSFTGDAIFYLAKKTTSFNMSEWEWHIEIIDGQQWYIVTDKKVN